MPQLEGKIALLSGGARGIGEAIARVVADEGGHVVIGDVLDAEGRALADEIGPSAAFVHLDVRERADWEAAVATTVETFGALNVLVNNAGISSFGAIDEYTHADWDAVLAVNLTGVFNGIKAAIPALKQAAPASIVNVSSVHGLRGDPYVPGYVASKFGVTGLTKAAAVDLGQYGIRVNSVHPGLIETPMTAGAAVDVTEFALGRAGAPGEIAQLITYLASDQSSYCTGAQFVADGGLTAGTVRAHPMPGAERSKA